MKRTTRLLAGTFTTLALTAGLLAGAAGTSSALLIGGGDTDQAYAPWSPVPTAYPGLYIDFDGDANAGMAGPVCTLGPVGTDSVGRNVGITAGHCNPKPIQRKITPDPGSLMIPKYVGAPRGEIVTTNDHPVYDHNAVLWAHKTGETVPPIGWIRWVDGNSCTSGQTFSDGSKCPRDPNADAIDNMKDYEEGKYSHVDVNPNSTTDYMVIEFAPGVQLSSQVRDKSGQIVKSTLGGGDFKVNSINRDSTGAPALPKAFDWVENFGGTSDRAPALLGNGVAPSAGMVTGTKNGIISSFAGSQPGDSGGPVVMRGTGKWVGITFAAELGNPIYTSTSAKSILGDLNPRGVVGSGFTPVNN